MSTLFFLSYISTARHPYPWSASPPHDASSLLLSINVDCIWPHLPEMLCPPKCDSQLPRWNIVPFSFQVLYERVCHSWDLVKAVVNTFLTHPLWYRMFSSVSDSRHDLSLYSLAESCVPSIIRSLMDYSPGVWFSSEFTRINIVPFVASIVFLGMATSLFACKLQPWWARVSWEKWYNFGPSV